MSDLSCFFKLRKGDFQLDISLHAPANKVTALFGPSGSGKTTILRCLAGLEQSDKAFIEFQNQCWQDSHQGLFTPAHQRPIGYVFQQANLFPHLSARQNLMFGYNRLPVDQRQIDPEQAIELLGVGHLLKRQTYHLSGGEKQRVAIARTLLVSPRLLLMDEPLSALDANSKQEILPYLERLQKELALTVIYVTHALNEVFRLADEMILLDKGKPVLSGKPEELMLRHDFARAHGKQVGIVIECRVTGHDDHYHLTSLEYPGGQLFIERQRLEAGAFLKLKICAEDVGLSLTQLENSSSLNQAQGRIKDLDSSTSGHVFVRLDVNGQEMLARINQNVSSRLKLHKGQRVYVQLNKLILL